MEDELVRLIRRQSTQLTSFEVTFNHIGVFSGGKVLFAAPDCSKELLNLKEVFGTSYGWTPHTTMMIDESDVILKSLPIIMNHFTSFAGKITTLYLYEFFPAWHILTVHLSGTSI